MRIDDYIRTLESEGVLQSQLKSTLDDYHEHKDYIGIKTWDEVVGYMAKPEGIDGVDDGDDTDQILSNGVVQKFLKAHKINVYHTKKTAKQIIYYVDCINSGAHTTTNENHTDSFISVSKNGIINYHCNHAHCDGIFWKEYKKYYEDRDGKKDSEKPIKSNKKPLKTKKMSEYVLAETKFLYNPYLPFKLVIMSAYPGSGKTYICCYIVARITKGLPLFEGIPNLAPDRRKVIYFSSEDGYEDTIGIRLKECHADMDNVVSVEFDDDDQLDFEDNRLEELIKAEEPALIVFDTMQNFIGNVNMNAANETTRKMRALVRLADQYKCCILLIAHINKNEMGSAITRTIGSTDIVGKCRSYMCVGNVPDEDNTKYLSHEKCNVGKLGETILFEITPELGGITFRGKSMLKADDYAYSKRNKGKKSPELDAVKDFIVRNMPSGKREASAMWTLCDANGLGKGTIDRAKKALGITSIREGGLGNGGTWYWVAPENGFCGTDGFQPIDYTKDEDFDT